MTEPDITERTRLEQEARIAAAGPRASTSHCTSTAARPVCAALRRTSIPNAEPNHIRTSRWPSRCSATWSGRWPTRLATRSSIAVFATTCSPASRTATSSACAGPARRRCSNRCSCRMRQRPACCTTTPRSRRSPTAALRESWSTSPRSPRSPPRLTPPEQRLHAQSEHHQHRLAHDVSAHFALAHAAVDERDRHFVDAEAVLIAAVIHLDLEGVAVRANALQVQLLQHVPAEALEAAGQVVDGDTQDEPRVDRAAATDECPQERPVARAAAGAPSVSQPPRRRRAVLPRACAEGRSGHARSPRPSRTRSRTRAPAPTGSPGCTRSPGPACLADAARALDPLAQWTDRRRSRRCRLASCRRRRAPRTRDPGRGWRRRSAPGSPARCRSAG